MNAVNALKEARAAGVGIVLDSAALILRSSGPPPADVIEELSRYKADIVPLLRALTLKEPLHDVGPAGRPDRITAPREAKGIPWAEWKAAELNRLFQEQGITGQPRRINAVTILHGDDGRNWVDSAATSETSMSRAEATK